MSPLVHGKTHIICALSGLITDLQIEIKFFLPHIQTYMNLPSPAAYDYFFLFWEDTCGETAEFRKEFCQDQNIVLRVTGK